jgi:hypothetical protein
MSAQQSSIDTWSYPASKNPSSAILVAISLYNDSSIQSFGDATQSISHLNLSQLIHPIGGVLASSLLLEEIA